MRRLRALHRAYILHTLDELGDQPNVIFGIAYQYAGPLAFEQFFQDTVREWEESHGKHVRIALTTSKQTTDAILEDPIRSKQIAVVDMRYWEYLPDGTLFAPKAGENHAFRELISQRFPGYTDTPPSTTPEQVYREVREYRDRYPDKVFMPMEAGAGPIPILMAGAASPSALQSRPPTVPPTALESATAMYPQRPTTSQVPGPMSNSELIVSRFVHTYLATALIKMSPKDGWVAAPEHTWVLAGGADDLGSCLFALRRGYRICDRSTREGIQRHVVRSSHRGNKGCENHIWSRTNRNSKTRHTRMVIAAHSASRVSN